MSDAMMANLSAMADSMTYEEVLAAISLFLERLKMPFEKKEKNISKEQKAFQQLLAHANSLHLNSNGCTWTREELYER